MRQRWQFFLVFLFISAAVTAQPFVTSVSPEKGAIGTTVTIQGNNFSSIPANNFVCFGSVKATVLTATSTSLTVVVPKGANNQDLTVTTLNNNLVGYAPVPFLVTFPGGDKILTDSSFKAPVTFDAALGSGYLVVSDIDGDGKPDLACLGPGGNSGYLSLHRNTTIHGSISFAPKIDMTLIGTNAQGITLGDLNGDGLPELIEGAWGRMHVLKNNSTPGNIVFTDQELTLPEGGVYDIKVSDIDKDGRPDLVFSNDGALCLLRNIGSGSTISFGPLVTVIPKPVFSISKNAIAVGDLDRDGKMDLVMEFRISDTLAIVRNISTPGNFLFEAPVKHFTSSTSQPHEITLADVDGDGFSEILFADSGDDRFSILKNRCTPGTISFEYAYALGNLFQSDLLASSDINGDGRPDVITTSTYLNDIIVLANDTYGCKYSFNPSTSFIRYVGYTPRDMLLADINEDGKPDIIMANETSQKIMIFKNNVGQSAQICSGGNVTIPSSISGSSFQWQTSSGGSFVNLTNNTQINGAQSPLLQITGSPLSWNGYRFRCIVDTDTSNVFSLVVKSTVTPLLNIVACPYYLCAGQGTIRLYSETTDGGSSPSYQWQDSTSSAGWKDITGATSATLTYNSGSPGTKIRCQLTSSIACASPAKTNSNVIVLQNLSSVAPSISISGNTILVQGQYSAITSTATNVSSSAVYQWQDSTSAASWKNIPNAGGRTLNYFPQKNGDGLRCMVNTTGAACSSPTIVYSNVLTFAVTAVTAIPLVAGNSGPIIYPNPADKYLTIDSLNWNSHWLSALVVAMDGRTISPFYSLSGTTKFIMPVQHLAAGSYFLILRRKNGETVLFRFIKI